MTLVSGVFLPAGVGVEPEPVFVDSNNYESIQQHIGGLLDVVRLPIPAEDGGTGTLLGYVHDEGLILDLEYNYLATALFKQELRGGCVVVWGNNPFTGAYDGEIYDLPSELYSQLFQKLVEFTASVYNEAIIMEAAFQYAVQVGVITDSQYDELVQAMAVSTMHKVPLNPEAKAIYDKVMEYLATEISKEIEVSHTKDEILQILKNADGFADPNMN